MALEIERKWLINPADVPFDLETAECHHIVQSYLSFKPQVRLRQVDDGAYHKITVKIDAPHNDDNELSRTEFEAVITPESYAELSCETTGKVLDKRRFVVPVENGLKWEIDVYSGEFEGLSVAEMEFSSEEDARSFIAPAWCGQDISTDPDYKNVVMAQG